ncbi:MAG: hypothetical protein M0Z53_02615 [Thermaerobacter sp.]|nr:hypothetical protein [Thermaerobacter sp.]
MTVFEVGRFFTACAAVVVMVDGIAGWRSAAFAARWSAIVGESLFFWHGWLSPWTLLWLIPAVWETLRGYSSNPGRPSVTVVETVAWVWWILSIVAR